MKRADIDIGHIPDNVRVIVTDELPDTIHGCIAQVEQEQFLILINGNDSEARQRESLEHELWHYYNDDFNSGKTVNEIESIAHSQSASSG